MAPGITDYESVFMILSKHTDAMSNHAANVHNHNDRITKLEEDITALSGSGSTLTGENGISITNDVITVDFSHSGFNTDNITESTNLYYTDARARSAISVSGDLTYDNSTGEISFTSTFNQSLDDLSDLTITNVASGDFIYYNGTAWVNVAPDTGYIQEGSSNLYFTDARVLDTLNNATSVGIGTGTNTLSSLLNIRGTGDAIRIESTNTGVGGAQIDLLHYTTSPTNNDVHGSINFGGYTQSGSDQAYGSSIKSIWTDAAAKKGALEIWTRDGGGWQHYFKVNHHGGLALGPGNEGYEGQVLSIKSGNGTNVLYGESTGSMCLVSTRDAYSTANIGFGAEGNAHVFTSDSTVRVKINSANITLANYVNIGRTGSGAMAIFGHNTEVDESVNNKVVAATEALQSHFIRMYHNHGISFHCASQTHSANHTLYNLNDGTSLYERVRFHDTGEVSIGNTAIINSGATSFLSVGDGSGNATISIYTGTNSYGYLNFARSTSGVNSDPGYIRYNHNDDSFLFATSPTLNGGSVHIGTGGTEASGSTNGGVTFSNDTNGRKNLICATTSINNLELVEFRNPNGTVGKIMTNGSSTSFNTSSDYRLKENVNYEWDASTRLKQLKPARFNFKTDNDTVDGFLAHEVSDIVPNAVSGEKDGEKMQSIDHSKLVPLLVKALQEQQKQIDEFKSELHALKSQNK
jgi:hypothetical protein